MLYTILCYTGSWHKWSRLYWENRTCNEVRMGRCRVVLCLFLPNTTKFRNFVVPTLLCGDAVRSKVLQQKASDMWQGAGGNSSSNYNDVIISTMESQITGVSTVCSIVGSSADQRKRHSYASLAFVRGIHRWPVNSPHKGPVMRKMCPFDDVIMMSENQ